VINIEPEVLTAVASALKAKFPEITVSGTEQYTASSFPYVFGEEADNYSYIPSQDSGSLDNHANLMYEFNVYSNKRNGKKTEARQIAAVISNKMSELGFTRTTQRPFEISNGSLYRILLRFTGVAGKNGNIYRR